MTALEPAAASAADQVRARRVGVLLGLTAAVLWGAQLPIAKELFAKIDAYTLAAGRTIVAALCFFALLLAVEGRRALRFDGALRPATVIGVVGFGGMMLFYVGLEHTHATSAAVVVAMQPLFMAMLLRALGGPQLPRETRIAIAVAFAGVLLVITRGRPASLLDGSIGWGIGLVFLGQLGWIWYTINTARFGSWSPVRFSALTTIPAAVVLTGVAGLAAAAGLTGQRGALTPADAGYFAFASVGAAFLAVLAWNAGRGRLGPQNIALFQNLVPVVTYAIEVVEGYAVRPLELVGGAMTIGALVYNNMRAPFTASIPRVADRDAPPPVA